MRARIPIRSQLPLQISSGASSSIAVTINVDDDNDLTQIAGPSLVSFAENGTGAVARFTATDQDGDAAVWSVAGPDDGLFTISGGALRFTTAPDFEAVGTDNIYEVDVVATDGMKSVVVMVTNVDEAGSVTFVDPAATGWNDSDRQIV